MSYAGWVQAPDPDGGEAIVLAELGNCTSNVSPMWRAALLAVTGEEMRLQDTEGWTCERAWPVLRDAAHWMGVHKHELLPLNPRNGWGNYDGALNYISTVAELCRQFRAMPGAHLSWFC